MSRPRTSARAAARSLARRSSSAVRLRCRQVSTTNSSLGYDEVFRVAGSNRYDTAAAIASALGTGDSIVATTHCSDPVVDDGDARMGFYGNAALELRDNATACRVLGRTVVLAEGITGADALAAGWWTSFWQVPVLLHDGSDTLPAATERALGTLRIDNVIVLGGAARIPDSILADVATSPAGQRIRIAGADRYAHERRDGPPFRWLVADRPGRRVQRMRSSASPRRPATVPPVGDGRTRSAPGRGAARRTARPPATRTLPGARAAQRWSPTTSHPRRRRTTPSPCSSSPPVAPRCLYRCDNS